MQKILLIIIHPHSLNSECCSSSDLLLIDHSYVLLSSYLMVIFVVIDKDRYRAFEKFKLVYYNPSSITPFLQATK